MSERKLGLAESTGRLRRAARNLAALVALSAASAVPMLSLFPAETKCGPHRCEVSLTTDEYAEVQLGMIGSARLPLEDSTNLPFGFKATIKEIPSTNTSEKESADILDFDGELSDMKVNELGQLYSMALEDTDTIKQDVGDQLLKLTTFSAIGYTGLFFAIGSRRRQELADKLRQPKNWVIPATLGLLIASPLPAERVVASEKSWSHTGTVFENTPLEGLEVKGQVLQLSVDGVKKVLDYQKNVERFYGTAANNAVQELRVNREIGTILQRYPGSIIVIRTSDEHCNMGMNSVFSAVAHYLGATVWVSNGDMGIGDTPLDPICVQQIAKNMPTERIITPGNHDTDTLTPALEEAGFVIADGTVQEVGGLQFLGLPDPNTSPFGNPKPYDKTLTKEASRQIMLEACRHEVPPLLVAHTADMIKEAIRAGCGTYGTSGHTHKYSNFVVPQQDMVNEGYISVTGPSGGSKDGAFNLDILKAPAIFSIDVYKADENSEASLKETWKITVNPSQTVQLQQIPAGDGP